MMPAKSSIAVRREYPMSTVARASSVVALTWIGSLLRIAPWPRRAE